MGSDWCILEHDGERVLGRPSKHFALRAGALFTANLRKLQSQGRVLRYTPTPVPYSRAKALAQISRGPANVAKAAFRSVTGTHVTLREIQRAAPTQHDSSGCWLPGCNAATPDSQDHALLQCPASAEARHTLIAGISDALTRLGQPQSKFWLAITRGRRLGEDRSQAHSLSAFASSGVAAVTVAGNPLALIRSTRDLSFNPVHADLGAVARVGSKPPPPPLATRGKLLSWYSRASAAGDEWCGVPTRVLLNCAFRWQGVEPVHEHDPRPDALLEAIFLAASAPAHGASAGWPCLHHTAADILCDTLGVLTCLCPSALQLPRRSARALLAPGAPQLPLDPLLGARHWSQEALRETATDGGLLALLPPAAAAAPAYADLGELVTGGAARHCALLVPWDTSTKQLQAPALSGLLTAGFTAVAVLPPRLVPTTVLEPLGPPLLSHSSPDSQCPHVFLLSWEAPPGCAAAALAALGALARVRAGGTAYLPRASAPVPLPADPPPAQRAQTAATPSAAPSPATASGTLPSGVGTPRPTTAQPPRAPSDPWHPCCCPIVAPQATRDRGDLTWLWRLSIADLDRVQVVGNSNFVSEVVRHADALSALRPEEYLFPHLLDPLPTHVSAPIPRSPEYIGAALDDDAQPDRAASCAWLQETTLATLAAGITPLALHSVIAPWLQRRAQSARRARQPCALAPPRRLDPQVHPLPH